MMAPISASIRMRLCSSTTRMNRWAHAFWAGGPRTAREEVLEDCFPGAGSAVGATSS